MSADVILDLSIEELESWESLEALRPQWSSLWANCNQVTPFQAPEWLLPWWRHLGRGTLWTFALRADGRLVGMVPLYITNDQGPVPRKARFIGTGNTDYLDALFAPGFETPGVRALLARLAAQCDRWDVCEFQQLRPESPIFNAAEPAGLFHTTSIQEICTALELPNQTNHLLECIPQSQWKKLQYYRRRIAKLGSAQIERADRQNFEDCFDAFLRLHQMRWNRRNQPGVLSNGAIRRFLREAAWEMLQSGILRLYVLRVDHRIIAAFYGFRDRIRTHYYLGGFDPEYRHLSPGMLLVAHAIEEAIREGSQIFDFLRGGEAYKYAWGARNGLNYRRTLWKRSQDRKTE